MRDVLRTFYKALGAGLAVVALSACAARQPAGFAQRFIKPGEPSADYSQAAAPSQGLQEYSQKLRELQTRATPQPKRSLLPTIESRNPELAAALMKLALVPSAEHHRLAGDAYLNAGVKDFAFRHYHRALQMESCDSAALEGLARIWRDWGRPDLGLGDAHRAIYCKPYSASAYNTLATVLAALGQRKNAREALEFALRLQPDAAFALNNLCFLALRDGDGPAAQRACERALAVKPGMLAAHTNLALAYAIQGDLRKAEAQLLDGTDEAQAQYNIGMLRMSIRDYVAAAEAFERASATRPSLWDARRRAKQARELASAKRNQ